MGRLFVFSAPSGAGKTTIVNQLRKTVEGTAYSVSHTSRKPRENECDGVHYHFVDKNTFKEMIHDRAFVEWAEVYGNLYGTSFASLDAQTSKGLDLLVDVDPQGAKNIRSHYKDSVLIFILPPSLAELKKRLKARDTEDEGTLNLRLSKALEEIKNCMWYDYIVINDDLEKAIALARAIIFSERCKTFHMLPTVRTVFDLE